MTDFFYNSFKTIFVVFPVTRIRSIFNTIDDIAYHCIDNIAYGCYRIYNQNIKKLQLKDIPE